MNAAIRIGVFDLFAFCWKKIVLRARISISISVDTLIRFEGGVASFGSGSRKDFVESSRSGDIERGSNVA